MYPGYMDLSKVTLVTKKKKKIKDDPKEIHILLGWNSHVPARNVENQTLPQPPITLILLKVLHCLPQFHRGFLEE